MGRSQAWRRGHRRNIEEVRVCAVVRWCGHTWIIFECQVPKRELVIGASDSQGG
jgi:hypothetical protein